VWRVGKSGGGKRGSSWLWVRLGIYRALEADLGRQI
jgi:hypothetical protein